MFSNRQPIWTLARLFGASMVPVALLVVRIIYTGRITYAFMPWNMFLAWLPLIFAYLTLRTPRRRLMTVLFAASWLLFLPNAPYVVTDLMHLQYDRSVPVLYDVVMLFSFAITGLTLGFVSLRWMQLAVDKRFGAWVGRIFVLIILAMSGFGIYVGRYLRWNSWDVITNPSGLMHDLLVRVVNPMAYWHTWAMSMLFASLLIFVYWLWLVVPQLMNTDTMEIVGE